MFREEMIDFDDLGLNLAWGPEAGPPLLLLHGVMRRWTDFLPLIPSLMTRWRVIGLDFRGHGESGLTPDCYQVTDYVSDVVSVVRSCIAEPVVLYGHSLGAMAALGAAAREPELVRAIILEDPPFHTMGNRIGESPYLSQFSGIQAILGKELELDALAQALADVELRTPGSLASTRLGEVRDPSAIRYLASCLLRLDPDVLTPIVDGTWLDGYELDELLPRTQQPTLVMQGDGAAGGMLIDEDVARLRQRLARASIVRFAGVGHLIHGQDTVAAARVATGFLESLL
ncbi:MAG: alpha/beta hydrolase [Planctomycetes bacterium]|nr:alpha/beta hydrolase [Planctomycetota bacterium]